MFITFNNYFQQIGTYPSTNTPDVIFIMNKHQRRVFNVQCWKFCTSNEHGISEHTTVKTVASSFRVSLVIKLVHMPGYPSQAWDTPTLIPLLHLDRTKTGYPLPRQDQDKLPPVSPQTGPGQVPPPT